ncbi:regulatory protein MarR [Terriglobus saanensis SP1PR4]|uniref:Regulatory protein MarR n=1 Tax=Terriglobus saanensis (strain ATCC BAA-1853 / DSM 23119 / SP1PR4) TaxID=401053 RepID=E8V3A9_TERSS|nr:regulatory protein MarR [Terriglobus saanensis SP1PR4]
MSTKNQPNPEKLAEELHSTAIHLLRKLRRADVESGTTAPRLSALSMIVFNGPITLGKLAEAEQVRPPTMTRIVRALEEQALVLKTRDEDDGRQIHISATIKGKRLLLDGRNRRVQVLADLIKEVSEEEQANLLSALGTMQNLIKRMS